MRPPTRWLTLTLLAASTLVTALPAAAQTAEDSARALHLLNRATWGPRPTDIAAVLGTGATAWLDRQLQPDRISDRDVDARLKLLPSLALSVPELYRTYSPQAVDRARAMRDSMNAMGRAADPPAGMTPAQLREQQARSPQRLHMELVTAKLQRSVFSERQLEDVMTDFWFNHFNVFISKGQDRYLVGDYEKSAIRPRVFGRFEDLLIATAQHPAMLFYLDNWQSVYVDTASRAVRNAAPTARLRERGLNENYARELLELHTLGVDGGYTQDDVIGVARALTGWSFEPPNLRDMEPPTRQQAARTRARTAQEVRGEGDVPFVFRPLLHDRGEKVVLGRTLPAGRGIEDGMDVMRIVARHPSTARFVATKLVERFVSDKPPADLVDHLADVFTNTNGDLRAVTRALFTSEDFYRAEFRGTKVKTPYELVVSAARATNAEVSVSRRTIELLRTMGHLPYAEPTPAGYPAMSDDWVNSGAMLNRMNFGLDLAGGRVDGVRINPAVVLRGDVVTSDLLARVLPGIDTKRLARRIEEDLAAQQGLTPRTRVVRALGLALGSPEFQRR